ncbi:MAG TPA: hypothetical protein VKU00_03860 [Chthonomonadaceae bacterium]|nr:hypothetical protein [Chthonomonadaceae bacterium]
MIRVLTVATGEGGHWASFLRSCRRVGIEPEVIGWGQPYRGHTYRLKLLHRYLAEMPPEQTILFLDGWDSVVLAGQEEIEARYLAFDVPLLMSAERYCAPFPWLAERFPVIESPYRHVNAGNWIGQAGYVRALWERMGLWRLPDALNDQGVLTDWFLSHPGEIVLDHRCELFQNLYISEGDIDYSGERPRNIVTGGSPVLFHGSGGADMRAVLASLNL